MAAIRGAAAYRQTEAESRSPLELVVMLYDGALRFLGEAEAAHEAREIARRGRAVSRVLAILGELQSTLDMAQGGELAAELDRLYAYMQERLLAVTLTQDPAPLVETRRLLSTLRDGWAQVAAAAPPKRAVG